jgi:hypothetical protein
MIVVYHDIGGTHSSCIAANIHINKLSKDVIPDKDTLMSLPTFDRMQMKDWGHFLYIGDDEFGAKVYTVCRQRVPQFVVPAITDMFNIMNKDKREMLYLINTSPTVNVLMGIGGLASRRMELVRIGRPIVIYGAQKAYKNIAKVVDAVKNTIREDLAKVKNKIN